MKKIIYDLGANSGENIQYFLKKGDIIVAVEANPVLCEIMTLKFANQIKEKKLFIENCVLTANEFTDVKEQKAEEVDFYVHLKESTLSQFPEPTVKDEFIKIKVKSLNVINLISKYGNPYYIKIDLESYDSKVLENLFINKIFPPFISAESHSIQILSLMISMGKYNAFKLVQGYSVQDKFKDHKIMSLNGEEKYSFPKHSSGPFGQDIPGEWMTADNFFEKLAYEKLGWKDIHATSLYSANPKLTINRQFYINNEIKIKIYPYIPKFIIKIRNLIRQFKFIK
jgi:FkbM family methyltransferase